MKKLTRSVKRLARKLKKSVKPLYLVPVVLVVGLIVAGIFIFGGGDDGPEGPDPSLGFAQGDPSSLPGSRRPPPKQAPRVRNGVVDEARRVGRLAVAQARGTVIEPTRVRVRVSAAPKQRVTVNWQLGCYRDRRTVVGKGAYETTPPDVREIKLPMRGAETCIATAGAQLTENEGEGRIKVAVIAGN